MRTTIFLSVIDRALAVCILIACVLVLRTILKKAPRRMLLLLWLPVALRLLSPMTVQSRFSLLPASLSQSLSAYFQEEETTNETPQTGNSQTGTQPGMNLSDDFQTNIGQSGTQADTDVSGKAQNTANPNKIKPADGQTGTNPSGDIQNPSDPGYVVNSPEASDSKLSGQVTPPDAVKLPNNGGLSAAPKKTLFLKTASTVWLAGVLLLAAYVLFEQLRLRRLTKTARVQEIDGISVYFGEHIPAPFLCGLFTPRIYLPDGLAAEYLPPVLAHESVHKNGRDNLLKPLAFLITVIYWFHPLVWLSYILFCEDLELACDERVISNLDTGGRKKYSQTLLAISTMPRTVYGYPVAFGETDVAGRIQHILSFREPKKTFAALCVLFCVTLTACFSTNPEGSGKPPANEEIPPISQGVSVTPQPESVDFSNVEKHVVWYHDSMLTEGKDSSIFIKFNQLLLERGYDFVVDFVTELSLTDMEYRSYQKKLRDYKKNGQQVDLIFTGWGVGDDARTYDSAIQDELLVPLEDYFAAEQGTALYEAFPENIWEMLRRDGKVYGVCEIGWYGAYYSAALNKELLRKYKVEAPDTFSLEAFLETICEVYEKAKQKGEDLLPVYLTEDAVYSYLGYYKLGDFWLKQDSDGTVSFVNPYEDEEVRRLLVILEEYRKVFGDFGTREQQIVYGNSGKMIGEFLETQMKLSCQNQNNSYPAVTYEPQTVFYSMPVRNTIQGVSSWATYPEEAKTLLTLITTDEEFVNLLYYGTAGVNYQLENGHAYPSESRNLRAPGFEACVNGTLVYPEFSEPADKKAILQKQQREVVILPLTLSEFSTSTLTEEERKIAEVFREADGLWLGAQENAVQKAEQYCERLRELNVEEVLQKMTQNVWEE